MAVCMPAVAKTDPEDFQITAGKVMGPGWKLWVASDVAVAASFQCQERNKASSQSTWIRVEGK